MSVHASPASAAAAPGSQRPHAANLRYGSPRRRRRGETLLELLIAIALFALVFVAFAMVFPAGFRLNLTNMNESKAVHFGGAVLEEINGLPFNRVEKMVGNGWPDDTTLSFDVIPRVVDRRVTDITGIQAGDDFVRVRKEATTLPQTTNVYFLPEAQGGDYEKGIVVNVYDACPIGSTNPFAPALKVADIRVNVYWYESRKKQQLVLRHVSLSASRPSNVVNQGGY